MQNYKLWLKRRLQPGQSVSEGAEGIRAINNNLNKAGQFLSLASLLSVLLAVIAIVISSHQYAIRQNRNHAVMMCLGATAVSRVAILARVTSKMTQCLSLVRVASISILPVPA